MPFMIVKATRAKKNKKAREIWEIFALQARKKLRCDKKGSCDFPTAPDLRVSRAALCVCKSHGVVGPLLFPEREVSTAGLAVQIGKHLPRTT